MTASSHTIRHPAHRHTRRTGAHRIASMLAAVTRHQHTDAGVSSHGGQLGSVREAELGRRTGARI